MNWDALLLGLGIAAMIEGLVIALAPLRFEELLKTLAAWSTDQRRFVGLGIASAGLLLVWIAS